MGAKNLTSGVQATIRAGSGKTNHGLYSTGYSADGATFTSDPKWMVYRNSAGVITLNGNCTGSSDSCTGNAVTATTAASADRLNGYNQGTRLTSANLATATNGVGSLFTFVATSSMTTGKPPWDAHVLQMNWDNTGGWDAQLAVGNGSSSSMAFRGQESGTWGNWTTVLDANNYTDYAADKAHTHTSLVSKGTVNPQSGRTQAYGDVYAYNTNASACTGAPTTYTSAIGFGRGTSGSVEIAGGWASSGQHLYWRALRDTTDSWYGWKTLLDSSNWSTYCAAASHTHAYVPTSGGTVSGNLAVTGKLVAHQFHVAVTEGTTGTTGYALVAEIDIKGTYVNAPLTLRLVRRGSAASVVVNIQFLNVSSTDPGIASFTYSGPDTNMYLYKLTTGVWYLYVQKSEGYDSISTGYLNIPNYDESRLTVSFISGSQVSAIPSSTTSNPVVQASKATWYGNAATATKLATARKLTIGSTGKNFDGSAAVSWTLAEIGAAAASHTHSAVSGTADASATVSATSTAELTATATITSGYSVFLTGLMVGCATGTASSKAYAHYCVPSYSSTSCTVSGTTATFKVTLYNAASAACAARVRFFYIARA